MNFYGQARQCHPERSEGSQTSLGGRLQGTDPSLRSEPALEPSEGMT